VATRNASNGPKSKAERGSAIVEFGMLAPVLILMLMGAIDFARVFFTSISVVNAARAGVQYGLRSNGKSGDLTGMQNAALADGSDIAGMTATATRFCQCSDGATANCLTGSCGTYGRPRIYVKVTTAVAFQTLFRYPGVPATVNLTKSATMREQ
jgi:Flp pilus assembly protein TadG